MTTIISEPKINSIVHHTGWRLEDNENYPCDVMIVDGRYGHLGRISNFWKWRRILPDGNLAPTESGYGSFETSESEYKTTIKVTKIN